MRDAKVVVNVRTLVLFTSLIVALLSTSVVAQRTTAPAPLVQSPEIVLKEFYKWYIHNLGRNVDPLKSGKTTMRKYVTLRFIREIERNEKLPEGEGFDADYFLQTQEYTAVTDKRIVISHVALKGSAATAVVTFDDGYPKVRVNLRQEADAWKIDNVKDVSQPPPPESP